MATPADILLKAVKHVNPYGTRAVRSCSSPSLSAQNRVSGPCLLQAESYNFEIVVAFLPPGLLLNKTLLSKLPKPPRFFIRRKAGAKQGTPQ
jgi:hypothetical protein